MRPMFHRNRIVLVPVSSAVAAASARRPLVASLAGILLGLLPAAASAEPKLDPHPPRYADLEKKSALVIVGGGGMPDTIRDRFLQLAGGKDGKLVVIPTASELADRTRNFKSYTYWQRQGLASVSMLHTLDPKKANDPAFVKPLTEATAAWLGGGDQSRLAGAYRGTAVEKELRRLLARGGVIGGTSAGASVMSAVMITGGNPQARIGTGFGLLPDVVIDQHFGNRKRQKRLQSVLVQHPHCLGLGIDEQTAVVVQGDGSFTVMGAANVVLCMPSVGAEPPSLRVLKSGEAGNLLQLAKSLLAPLKATADTKSVASKERHNAP
jgi:cyanophycinase